MCCFLYFSQCPRATFNAVSIAGMPTHGSRPESLYVAMSRAKTIDTSFLLENISESDLAHFIQGP